MTLASDSYYMFLRWMKKLVRNPILLFFSLFQPIIFLVLFTQLFSSFGLLLGGINYTMLATPASRASILLGRLLSDAFRDFAQSLIILVLAYGLGVFPVTGFIGYVLILFTVAFFGLAWSGISLALGLRTKSAETVFGIAGTLTFPLLFMSTALMDKRLMPEWMKNVSAYNPISFAVNAIRDLIINGYNWNSFLLSFGVISLIAILTMGATIYEFRKVVS